jgi:hypothetical protein
MDIEIKQGADFQLGVTWQDDSETPIDLTGYTARCQVRASMEAETTLLSITEEESDDGQVAIGDDGEFTIWFKNAATELLDPTTSAVWDVELVSPGNIVTRLLEGTAVITPEVTR